MGQATIDITGGTPPYTISGVYKSGDPTNRLISSSGNILVFTTDNDGQQNTYTAYVRDSNECSILTSTILDCPVTQPVPIPVPVPVPVPVSTPTITIGGDCDNNVVYMNGTVTYPNASQFRIRLRKNDVVVPNTEILVTGPTYNYSLQGNGPGNYKIEVWIPDVPDTTYFSAIEPVTDCGTPVPVPVPNANPILGISSGCSGEGYITVFLDAGNYSVNRYIAYLEKYDFTLESFQGNQPNGTYYLNPTSSGSATHTFTGLGNGQYRVLLLDTELGGDTVYTTTTQVIYCPLPVPVPVPIPVPLPVPVPVPIPIPVPVGQSSVSLSANCNTFSVSGTLINAFSVTMVLRRNGVQIAALVDNRNGNSLDYEQIPNVYGDGLYEVYAFQPGNDSNNITSTAMVVNGCTPPTPVPISVPAPVPAPIPVPTPIPAPVPIPIPVPVPTGGGFNVSMNAVCSNSSTGQVTVSGNINLPGVSQFRYRLRKDGVDIGSTETLVNGSSVDYNFNYAGGNGTYVVQVWNTANPVVENYLSDTVSISNCSAGQVPIPIPAPIPIPVPVPTGGPNITFNAICSDQNSGLISVSGSITLPGVSQFRYRLLKNGSEIGSTETLVNGSSTNYAFTYNGGSGNYRLQVWNTANPVAENYLSNEVYVPCSATPVPVPQPTPVPIPVPVPTGTPTPNCVPVAGGSLGSNLNLSQGASNVFAVDGVNGDQSGPLTFSWSATNGAQLISGGGSGNFAAHYVFPNTGVSTVQVVVSNACSSQTYSVQVTVSGTPTPTPTPVPTPVPTPTPVPAPASITLSTNTVCLNGGSTGPITVNYNNSGFRKYAYYFGPTYGNSGGNCNVYDGLINDGIGSITLPALLSGSYDTNGYAYITLRLYKQDCSYEDKVLIFIRQDCVTAALNTGNECTNSPYLQLTGFNQPVRYSWSEGSTFTGNPNSMFGTYADQGESPVISLPASTSAQCKTYTFRVWAYNGDPNNRAYVDVTKTVCWNTCSTCLCMLPNGADVATYNFLDSSTYGFFFDSGYSVDGLSGNCRLLALEFTETVGSGVPNSGTAPTASSTYADIRNAPVDGVRGKKKLPLTFGGANYVRNFYVRTVCCQTVSLGDNDSRSCYGGASPAYGPWVYIATVSPS